MFIPNNLRTGTGKEGENPAGGRMGIMGKGQGHSHSHPTYTLGSKQGGRWPQPWHLGGKFFAHHGSKLATPRGGSSPLMKTTPLGHLQTVSLRLCSVPMSLTLLSQRSPAGSSWNQVGLPSWQREELTALRPCQSG